MGIRGFLSVIQTQSLQVASWYRSYMTRFTPLTSLTIRLVTLARTSQGISAALGGHEVGGVYGTEGDGVIVGTEITHNTYGTHVGQGCEILTKTFVDSCFCDLFAVDGVGFLNDFYFFLGYFSDDTDSKAGTREGLTVHQILGDTKLQTGAPNLIFKKKT